METLDRATKPPVKKRRAPRTRNKTPNESRHNATKHAVCACVNTPPLDNELFEFVFSDGAILRTSVAAIYNAGHCCTATLGRLINDFNLEARDDGVITVPFLFMTADSREPVHLFLQQLLAVSVQNYATCRLMAEGGAC